MKSGTWTWIIIGLALVGAYAAYSASQQPQG